MNYSYYQDEKGRWWWCMLAIDSTVLVNSGSGYDSEQECLEAIARISGSSNGRLVKLEKTNDAGAAKVADIKTALGNPIEKTKPAEKLEIEIATSFQIPSRIEALPKEELGTNAQTSKSNEAQTLASPEIVANKKLEAQKEEVTLTTVADDLRSLRVDVMLGESPVASVFTTKDNQLRWKYRANKGDVPTRLLPAIAEFDSIMATIATSVAKPYRKDCYHRLGKALFAAFHTQEGARPAIHFRAVRLLVRTKAKERARLVYVVASMAATMLLVLGTFPIYYFVTSPEIRLIALGGCFGSIGASISVLQRNPSLDIDPWMSNGYLRLQGITRIVLGFIFGFIFVLASKANFVLGVVRDNPYPLLVLCIVAGFSERVIPELLSRFESSNAVRTKIKDDVPED
jgi:uncharacterized protein YegP (UPF0339 family)